MKPRGRRRGVLDASAVLAFINREPGWRRVRPLLSSSVVSSVNWAEVAQKLLDRGVAIGGVREDFETLGTRFEPFTVEDAEQAAVLRGPTQSLGLSLADRACMALAARLDLPAFTADRAWKRARVGVRVHLVR